MTTLVDRVAGLLDDRSSRRGFLARVAVVGSALSVGPVRFLVKPGTAYAAVCGVDSTCSSGYTVFCATVNGGVNRCPPGSLVGGWWKSDGSGFCCGNARYYIDCHSYCACGCGGGSNFCGEGCRNCSCGCGPAGQCDQRKVCCNEFRYGQCNQDVSCTGPVWCRVVTCTPPWRIPAWKCSTTSATDQRTGSHSAPALEDCTAIGAKYTALGGQGSRLGEPRTKENPLAGGARFQHFDAGSLYWSSATGAHEVRGTIRSTYERLGWERGPLGLPVTDELPTPDGRGRYNHFQGGSVYWTADTGAHAVQGSISEVWARLGWESGPLGYPLTDETRTPDGTGRYNHFQGGSVYWTADTGAHAVRGSIRETWERLGWESGPLGYPLTDETATPDRRGRYNHFENGSVYWTPTTGAHAVQGSIRAVWARSGWEAGPLGYPLTDETATPDGRGRYNRFEDGSVYWSPTTGAHAVRGPVRDRWERLGWEAGRLGYPRTDEAPAPGGTGRYEEFTGGSIYWSTGTGAHSVSGRIRTAWLARDGAAGDLGLPTSEPAAAGTGKVRQDFVGGYAVLDTDTDEVRFTLT